MNFNYYPLDAKEKAIRSEIWNALKTKRPFNGAAVNITSYPDWDDCVQKVMPADQIPLADVSAERNAEWDENIRGQIHRELVCSVSRYQCDRFPAIAVPRSIFGQTQGLAEIFGSRLIPVPNEDHLYFPVPCIEEPKDVENLRVKPVEDCMYGNAVPFMKYAYESTEGQLATHNPVMTGPIDTANYIMGTTRLMEWIYDYPQSLHSLLDIITEQLIKLILSMQAAVGGNICPECASCLPCGYSFCSEVRHLISKETYDEFEAPYLRRISETCGLYAYHSCGTYERVLETDMRDNNLMLVNFQTKEMDLKKVHGITGGRLSLSVGRSVNLHERYMFPDNDAFYNHFFNEFPGPAPVEVSVNDVDTFINVFETTKGGKLGDRSGIRVKTR